MRQLTGAQRVTVALKRKNEDLVDLMRDDAQQAGCEFFVYEDVYPAGDEYVLVYEITGRQIPPGGLPLHVDCVVDNVETIINIGKAVDGTPVTEKYVTITGAVHHPLTTVVPIGTSFQDCLRAAGGCTVDDPTLLVSGVMMGGVSKDMLHARDQDHGRTHRAAIGPLSGASQDGHARDLHADRARPVRPVFVLHRTLPALHHGLSDRAAPRHAHAVDDG